MQKKFDLLVSDLCAEIDEWRKEAEYWKAKYMEERDARNMELTERLEESKKGVANALMFCLSVKDNEDGSLSISKEDRKLLAESIN